MKEDTRIFASKINGVSNSRIFSSRNNDKFSQEKTYLAMLKEVKGFHNEFQTRISKIKANFVNMDFKYYDFSKDLMMKFFIHEISCIKNYEYDLNNTINVFLKGI